MQGHSFVRTPFLLRSSGKILDYFHASVIGAAFASPEFN